MSNFQDLISRLCRIMKRSHTVQVKTGRVNKIFHLSILCGKQFIPDGRKIDKFHSRPRYWDYDSNFVQGCFSCILVSGFSYASWLFLRGRRVCLNQLLRWKVREILDRHICRIFFFRTELYRKYRSHALTETTGKTVKGKSLKIKVFFQQTFVVRWIRALFHSVWRDRSHAVVLLCDFGS